MPVAGGLIPPLEIPEYTNWILPAYAASTNLHQWPQKAYELAAFDAPYTQHTLLTYLFGDLSPRVS